MVSNNILFVTKAEKLTSVIRCETEGTNIGPVSKMTQAVDHLGGFLLLFKVELHDVEGVVFQSDKSTK